MMWYFSHLIYANKRELVWIYQPGHKPVCQLLSHLVTGTGGGTETHHAPADLSRQNGSQMGWVSQAWDLETLICLMVLFRASRGSCGASWWKLDDRRGIDTKPSQSQFPFLPHPLKKKRSIGPTLLPLDGINWELSILSITGIRRRPDCRIDLPFVGSVPLKVQALISSVLKRSANCMASAHGHPRW